MRSRVFAWRKLEAVMSHVFDNADLIWIFGAHSV